MKYIVQTKLSLLQSHSMSLLKFLFQKLIRLYFVGLLLSSSSHAAIETQDWSYKPRPNFFIPGYTMKRIQEGRLIGQFKNNRSYDSSSAPTSLQEAYLAQLKQQSLQKKSYPKMTQFRSTDFSVPDVSNQNGERDPLINQPITAINSQLGSATNVGSYQPQAFLKCAKTQIKELSKALKLQEQLTHLSGRELITQTHNLNYLHFNINKTRLIRPQYTLPQMSCSVHLGKKSFPVKTTVEEIQILSALSSENHASSLDFLLQVVWLAYHPSLEQLNPIGSLAYSKMWQELALAACFSTEKLPSLEVLTQNVYQRSLKDKEGVFFGLDLATLQKHITDAQNFLNSAWKK